MRRRLTLVLVLIVVSLAAFLVAMPYVHGLSFVIRAADMHGLARRLADLDTTAEREREIAVPTSRGSMRARVYEPVGSHRRAALLVSGLHPLGIDEPRVMRFARAIAATGVAIVTPDIAELSRFEITPAIPDAIEQAGVWLASQPDLGQGHKVDLMGISFSGGLSIVAAARPSLADRVASVFAFGGHDDLPRVLRYLCTGAEPYPRQQLRLTAGAQQVRLKPDTTEGGTGGAVANVGGVRLQPDPVDAPFVRTPHDYGVAVILLGVAERVVPAAQVEPLRAAVRRFLLASALDTNVDKEAAAREFEALKVLARRMPEPSATLLRYVNDRDVIHLGARLLPYVGLYGGDPSLSVSKSPKPSAPVFLLHGTDDNVIPSIESEYLAEDLRGHAPVRLLLSGLISHAEADQPPSIGDVMQLAAFWGDLLWR